MWLRPEIRTLGDIPRHWSARTPDKIALASDGHEITYADLDRQTARVSRALTRNLTRGDAQSAPVCFIGKNVPEFWIAWFGAAKANRAFVPLNWRCTAHELAEILADAGPTVVIAEREFASLIDDAMSHAGVVAEVVVFDTEAIGGRGLADWCGDEPDTDPEVLVHSEDIALIAYTSGTTGRPKGVMVRHEAFDLFHLSDQLEPTIEWSAEDVNLMVMPNFHLAGSWVSLPALYHGGTVAMLPAFEPVATFEAIASHRVTSMCLVPTAIQTLLASDALASADLSSLQTLIYAGSPIAASTIELATSSLDCELRQFYGTSETFIITILRPKEHLQADPDVRASCGTPVPLVSIRVVGPDGTDLPDGEVGQVLVRSPMVMAGYLGQPEETARVLQDGWYATGDLGHRSPSGHLFLVDRAKDMIVTGGENVYSVEVERALQRHPAVAMVAVVGVPDERWGEAVTAYVVPHPDAAGDHAALLSELEAHCRELIAAYKTPKTIHIESTLPMTPMGKVRKVDLRRRAATDRTRSN